MVSNKKRNKIIKTQKSTSLHLYVKLFMANQVVSENVSFF